MNWRKHGLIYCPAGKHGWDRQYAHLPTPWAPPGAQGLRIYFAALDEQRFGRITYVDVDPGDPARILAESPEPVLDLGEPGTFDDSGVNPACMVPMESGYYLYYIGWQRTANPLAPYMLFAGAAATEDGVRFRRLSRSPLLERTNDEPFLRSAVTILRENGTLRCWYVSGRGWTEVNGAPFPEYIIRYAESRDGLRWKAYPDVCIDLKAGEFGIGRPWIVNDGGLYRLWYSIRSRTEPYRIGYAESHDGLRWERHDELSHIPRSAEGWDSEMICYPAVIDCGGRRLMFYNGNRHGMTGFGYATLESGG